MSESEEAATEKSLLLAWAVLVVASTLLIVGVRLVYDVPDDLRYRYSTVVFAVLVSAAQLGVVLMIARRGLGRRGASPAGGLEPLPAPPGRRCWRFLEELAGVAKIPHSA